MRRARQDLTLNHPEVLSMLRLSPLNCVNLRHFSCDELIYNPHHLLRGMPGRTRELKSTLDVLVKLLSVDDIGIDVALELLQDLALPLHYRLEKLRSAHILVPKLVYR